MIKSDDMMSNYLNFFRKNDQKMHFPLAFFKGTENPCRRAESAYSRAYSRAIGARGLRFFILRRNWA